MFCQQKEGLGRGLSRGAMPCASAMVRVAAAGKSDPAVEENTDGRVMVPTVTVVSAAPAAESPQGNVVIYPRLPMVLSAAPKPAKEMPPRRSVLGVERRDIGPPTMR